MSERVSGLRFEVSAAGADKAAEDLMDLAAGAELAHKAQQQLAKSLELANKASKSVAVNTRAIGTNVSRLGRYSDTAAKRIALLQTSLQSISSSGAERSIASLADMMQLASGDMTSFSKAVGSIRGALAGIATNAPKASTAVMDLGTAMQIANDEITDMGNLMFAIDLFGLLSAKAKQLAESLEKINREAKSASASLKDMAAATTRANEAANRLERANKAVAKGAEASGGGVEASGNAAKRAANDYQRLDKMMGRVVARAAMAAIPFMVLGKALRTWSVATEVAVDMERLEKQMNFVLGSTLRTQQALTNLRGIANEAGFVFRDMAKEFASTAFSMSMVGMEARETEKLFRGVSYAAVTLGLEQAELNRMFYAFNQMAGKSRVRAEELNRQLGNALPGALGLAAEAMQMTVGEMMALMERGELFAADFLPAFADTLIDRFKGGVKDLSDTLAADRNRLKSEWEMFLDEMFPKEFVRDIVNRTREFIEAARELRAAMQAREELYPDELRGYQDRVVGGNPLSGITRLPAAMQEAMVKTTEVLTPSTTQLHDNVTEAYLRLRDMRRELALIQSGLSSSSGAQGGEFGFVVESLQRRIGFAEQEYRSAERALQDHLDKMRETRDEAQRAEEDQRRQAARMSVTSTIADLAIERNREMRVIEEANMDKLELIIHQHKREQDLIKGHQEDIRRVLTSRDFALAFGENSEEAGELRKALRELEAQSELTGGRLRQALGAPAVNILQSLESPLQRITREFEEQKTELRRVHSALVETFGDEVAAGVLDLDDALAQLAARLGILKSDLGQINDGEFSEFYNTIENLRRETSRIMSEADSGVSGMQPSSGGGNLMAAIFGEKWSDRLREDLENARQQYDLEMQLINRMQRDHGESQIEFEARKNKRIEELERAHQGTIRDIRDSSGQDQVKAFGQMQSDLLYLAQSGSKRAAQVYKAVAIGETIISTYKGAQDAFSSMVKIPYVGPALGAAAAGVAIAAGMARVQAIRNTNFSGAYEHGGMIPSGKFGLVGEAGPEIVRGPAVVSSARTTAGMLGSGQAPQNVKITVHNYSGARATVRESNTNEGKEFQVLIERVEQSLASKINTGGSTLSRSMESSYNLKRGG